MAILKFLLAHRMFGIFVIKSGECAVRCPPIPSASPFLAMENVPKGNEPSATQTRDEEQIKRQAAL